MRKILKKPAARNFLLNLLGNAIPMIAAIVALPIISREAGAARLGFLGLTWAMIGYFGLLDLGLSRVVTRQVAIAEAADQSAGQRDLLFHLCWRLFLVVGVLAISLAALIPAAWVAGRDAPPALLQEARGALLILWLTLPATVVTGLLRGALEGRQQFGVVNLLRIIFGLWSFAGPLTVLPWSHTLPALTLAVAIGRFCSLGAHYLAVCRALPKSSMLSRVTQPIWPFIREGGWLTISNVVGPLMVTFDRFAVAGLVSLSAAAFYFVPQEIALRMLFIPGALAATIFPMIASLSREEGSTARARISNSALLVGVIVSLPSCLILAGAARPLFSLWMGLDFATQCAPVAAILSIGLFANCAAQVPFSWIQAAGRADVTGRLHLAQLPVYGLVLVLLTWRFGILGAAWAWTLRATADCALLLYASSRLYPSAYRQTAMLAVLLGTSLVGALAASVTWLEGVFYWIGLFIGVVLAAALSMIWSRQLRAMIQS